MYINNTKREIVLTKAEYTKAMRIGTPEFEDLFRAKQMFPNAKVVIKKSDSKQHYKNLTKVFMLNYVKTNDKEYLEEFEKLFKSIGVIYFDEESNEYKEISFFYVRNTFLHRYPQFMTESDRKKYEEKKSATEAENKTEENTNVVEIKPAV